MIWGYPYFRKHPLYLIWFCIWSSCAFELQGCSNFLAETEGGIAESGGDRKLVAWVVSTFKAKQKALIFVQFSIVFPFMAENESLSFWLMDDPDLQQHEPMPGTDGWSEGTQGVPTRLSGRSDLELEKHLMSAAWQLSSLWSHLSKSLMEDL